jgi:MoxR-like ATPase
MSSTDIPRGGVGDWRIYRASGVPHDGISRLPEPPPWRVFGGGPALSYLPNGTAEPPGVAIRAEAYQADDKTIELVNAALYLRRPLLATGKPGTGKSTLARSIARELRLDPVLTWPITSRSTLREALYSYDAIARLQEAGPGGDADRGPTAATIGRYITMGPLGTALLPWDRPRVLLIDEIDKSDIDLPNDLLHVFEEGCYEIPELARLPEGSDVVEVFTSDGHRVPVRRGQVRCLAFPIVVITSNGEREFPPAFLRRCVRVDIAQPNEAALRRIVSALLGPEATDIGADLIRDFVERREHADIATDQLLNALYMVTSGAANRESTRDRLVDALLRELDAGAT